LRFSAAFILPSGGSLIEHFWFHHFLSPSLTQGEQIGRIFALWTIVFFGQFSFKLPKFTKIISAEKFMILFGQETSWATNTLGDFF
jgi:hypothetical protein